VNNEVKDFEVEVLQRSHSVPVLVDFWAPWCGPCRALGPVLERLTAQAGGRWVLVKVNTDMHPDLAARYHVASIPTVKLFRQGRVVDEFVGAMPEAYIRQWLDTALPSPHVQAVARAENLIAEGQYQQARQLLEPVVAAEPSNDQARLLLARCQLVVQPEAIEETLRPIAPSSAWAEQAEALRLLGRLAVEAAQPDRLPAGPVRDRFVAGAQALRCGDFAAALEAFIEVLGRQRDYYAGMPKQACKAIFQLLGIRHPIAERYHRAFASALHP
jgi:putative thioredoxin